MAATNTDGPRDILARLPPELQLRVFNNMTYQDALRLTQVNHYLHNLVDPRQWPVEEKIAFVKAAQSWPKHNLVSIEYYAGPIPVIHRYTDGHACFKCFRVRPVDKFSKGQITRQRAKHNARYGGFAASRFCIDCGIEGGGLHEEHSHAGYPAGGWFWWWRGRTDWWWSRDSHRLCDGEVDYCPRCGGESRRAKVPGSVYAMAPVPPICRRFLRCEQCHLVAPVLEFDQIRCMFCKKEICQFCGCRTFIGKEWWCGKACTKDGYHFGTVMMPQTTPFRPSLQYDVEQKRTRRVWKGESNVFEWEAVEDTLQSLAL